MKNNLINIQELILPEAIRFGSSFYFTTISQNSHRMMPAFPYCC